MTVSEGLPLNSKYIKMGGEAMRVGRVCKPTA